MDALKGKKILIGKEPGKGRLLVAVGGYGKTGVIGVEGSVPNCVSRCRPVEGLAHAEVMIDKLGNILLTNLKSENVTYVNGAEIASKRVSLSNKVELGKDHYPVNLNSLIDVAKKIVEVDESPNRESPNRYNISHLSNVWEGLQKGRKDMRNRQKRINMIRSCCSIFTMGGVLCRSVIGDVALVFTGVAFIATLYSFIGMKKDNTDEEQEKLNEEFQDKYVCPNPKCKKFLGHLSYRLLKRQYSMHCPYCKSEFYE